MKERNSNSIIIPTPIIWRTIRLFFSINYYFFRLWFAAPGILVPPPGTEPTPPALGAESRNQWTAKDVPEKYFSFFFFLNSCIKAYRLTSPLVVFLGSLFRTTWVPTGPTISLVLAAECWLSCNPGCLCLIPPKGAQLTFPLHSCVWSLQ